LEPDFAGGAGCAAEGLQEAFVRRFLSEARSLATSSPDRAKQIIVGLNPLMALMDSQAQERLGWIDVQAFLAGKRPTTEEPTPPFLVSASSPDWIRESLRSRFPDLA